MSKLFKIVIGIMSIGVVIDIVMWVRYAIYHYHMTRMEYFWANWEVLVPATLLVIIPYAIVIWKKG